MREIVFNKKIINGMETIVMETKYNDSYKQGINDFINFLNNNVFELRHDIKLIQKYKEEFLKEYYKKGEGICLKEK